MHKMTRLLLSLALLAGVISACSVTPTEESSTPPKAEMPAPAVSQSPAAPEAAPVTMQPSMTVAVDVLKPRHAPSLVATTQVDAKPEHWEDPEICGGCHERQVKGWKGSMHSVSFQDPIFQAEWALAEKATGGQLMNLCGGCHTPIGVLTNTVKFDPKLGKHGGFTASGVAEKGVSCDVCHTVSATTHAQGPYGSPGNASVVLSPGQTKYGPLKDAKSPYHQTAYSDLHTKAEFCGNCHNIFHPGNKFPIEHTYDEWKASPYAQQGIVCQDCHMVPVTTAVRVADEMKRPKDLKDHGLGGLAGAGAEQERSLVHDHGFVGGNSVVAPLLGVEGAEEHKAEAIKRLQNVAELDMTARPVDSKGNFELKVKVTNARAGHHLPTSLTFVRQIWLDVTVTDGFGRVVFRSGALDANNRPQAGAMIFRNHSVDAQGKPTLDPWAIARFDEMNTIPPKGYRYGTYQFNVSPYSGGFKVVAKLNYQSYDQAFADKLLGAGKLLVPTVEMKQRVQSFDLNGTAVAAKEVVRVSGR